MKKILILLFILFSINKISIGQIVNFSGVKVDVSEACENLGFADDEAKSVLDKICKAASIKNYFFMIPCNSTENCLANVKKNGDAYILYNNSFLNNLRSNSNGLGFTEKKINAKKNQVDDWSTIAILAHEIGHHENHHFSSAVRAAIPQIKLELDADEYAGSILYKLGATLQEAEQVYKTSIVPIEGSMQHPDRATRIKSLELGFNNEKIMAEKRVNAETSSDNTSQLILGSWMDDKGSILTFYNNGKVQISDNGKLLQFYWDINNDQLKLKNSSEPNPSMFTDFTISAINSYTLTLKYNRTEAISTFKRTALAASTSANDYLNKNWQTTIFIDKFDYTTRKIGGIWDINIPLVNKNDFIIDYVRVKVEYVKDSDFASGDIYKTEYVNFVNILPNTRQVIKAPDSDRGTQIRTKIVSVKSSKINVNN
jgi:hypothetical protein